MKVTYYVDTETARFVFYKGNLSEDEITELNHKISDLISQEIQEKKRKMEEEDELFFLKSFVVSGIVDVCITALGEKKNEKRI